MLPDFRVRQRDYLLEISRALTQELDLDKLLGRILQNSIELLAGQAGLIALRSDEGKWKVKVSHGLSKTFMDYVEPYLKEISTDPKDPENFELTEINRLLRELTRAASMGLLTGVGLPLVTQQRVVGVIFVFRGYRSVFSNNDRALLRSFGNQAAIAVQNAQLYSQIRREKSRTDALLDSVADGIIILSPDHKIERCNQSIVRMLGINPDEVSDKSFDEVFKWEKTSDGTTLEQAEAGGWPLTPHAHLYVEGDILRNNDLPSLPVGVTFAPLMTPEGILINIIASVRDITKFRQAEELKSTFISIISHELKTPIALIKGYVGTLRRDDVSWDSEIIQDSLEVIEEEADRLTELIENMLDASRLQAGAFALKLSDINIRTLAMRIAERFGTQTENHVIKVDIPEDFPVIVADEARITQVFSNLIGNAIKYSPEGEIRIRGSVKPDFVILCVSDEGPGIAVDDIPHVFDRFYRAPDMAKFTKGAGLGLYLTKSIIEAHSGRIWVDTDYNCGGRICFSLPKQLEVPKRAEKF